MNADIGECNIVYVMGAGRSGSTILELLLAQNQDVLNVGELTHIYRDRYIMRESCACEHGSGKCPLWMGMLENIGICEQDFDKCRRLFESIASHRKFLKHLLWGFNAVEIEVYRELNRKMFEYLASADSASTIVESSKYAGRALGLVQLFPDRVRVIGITRAPGSIIQSYRKKLLEQPPKSLIATTIYYCYTLLCMRLVKWKCCKQVLIISYEDLCDKPAETLDKIGKYCVIDTSRAIDAIASKENLDKGHMVTANRIKKNHEVIFFKRVEKDLTGRVDKLAERLIGCFQRFLNI